MGTCKEFGKEILVVGVLSGDAEKGEAIVKAMEERFGPAARVTAIAKFDWTDYYEPEMGSPIWRSYVEFAELVDPSTLAEIKRSTNELEARWADGQKRRYNLDPGLLAPGRFVLATTKDRAHRIALNGGIFAELTLIYEKGQFHALPWTYPDWGSEPVRTMLAQWRKRLFRSI